MLRHAARGAAAAQQQRITSMCRRLVRASAAAAEPATLGGRAATAEPKPRRSNSVSPADAEDSPFHELGLSDLWEDAGKTRVRQHVNPLCAQFQTPLGPLPWEHVYADPSLPLVVDLGCGYGRFLLLLQRRKPLGFNYLGIEIRQKLVDRSNKWAEALGCSGSVHYVFTNATISLAPMLSSYPGRVDQVYIQFPDPHFKKRHKKRQIFQAQLVHAIRDLLPPGGLVFLQSDVEPVSGAMRNAFEQHAGEAFELSPLHAPGRVFFSQPSDVAEEEAEEEEQEAPAPSGRGPAAEAQQQQQQQQQQRGSSEAGSSGSGEAEAGAGAEAEAGSSSGAGAPVLQPKRQWVYRQAGEEELDSRWAAGGWLLDNPVGVPTEREHSVTALGEPVFRVLLQKMGGLTGVGGAGGRPR